MECKRGVLLVEARLPFCTGFRLFGFPLFAHFCTNAAGAASSHGCVGLSWQGGSRFEGPIPSKVWLTTFFEFHKLCMDSGAAVRELQLPATKYKMQDAKDILIMDSKNAHALQACQTSLGGDPVLRSRQLRSYRSSMGCRLLLASART